MRIYIHLITVPCNLIVPCKSLTDKAQPNGLQAPDSLRNEIAEAVRSIEAKTPTKRPAYSPLMKGIWKLSYTDFSPAAPSSGKLGPFVGDVFQDLSQGCIERTGVSREVYTHSRCKRPINVIYVYFLENR